MKQCERCNREHDGQYGSGRFCSVFCSHARAQTIDTRRKTSLSLKGRPSTRARWTPEILERWKKSISTGWNTKYNNTVFDALGWDNKRRRIIEEQANKCKSCNLSHWKTVVLTFEINHIDGNSKNDVRENLEALCPNCHCTTDTWRGRNKAASNGTVIVSDEILIEQLKTKNIRQALLAVGLAPKGNNYIRAKHLISTFDAERSTWYRTEE